MPNLIDGSLVNAEAVLKGSELKRGECLVVRREDRVHVPVCADEREQLGPIRLGELIPEPLRPAGR